MVRIYEIEELKKLVSGCQKRSEVYERIKKAVVTEGGHFYNRSIRGIRGSLMEKGFLKNIKIDTIRKKNPQKKEKKKISSKVINTRLLALIESGILLEKNGFDKLHEEITKEFPDNRPDKRSFKNKIFNLIFVKLSPRQKSLNKTLQEITRMRLGDKETITNFKTIYSFVPDELIKRRMEWHQGLIKGRAKKLMGKNLPGIGRIDLEGGMPNFKIPRTSFKKPFHIKTKDSDNWPLMILNGTNFGLKHAPDIVGNITRKALSDAEMRRDEAIILTNFVCFDLKKAGGPAKTARAQILGDNINPELIRDKDYRKIVNHIISEHPIDQIAYRTTEELINDVLGGWIKVCTKPNNHPEYSGRIYISIGLNELALIFAITYWEIRWWTIKKQKELRGEIKILKKSLTQAKKELGEAEIKRIDGIIDDTKKEYSTVKNKNQELASLRYQLAITTISNVATQESQRFFRYAYSKVVQKIESAIPNSKVVGEGTSYFKINNQIIEIHIPSHLRVTDGLLSDYALGYGPNVLRGQNPEAVVICHPWSLQYRVTGRETDHDGKRDSMKVHVAPIAIDDNYLRSKLSPLRTKDHPIMKAIYNQTFKAGVLRLRCANGVIDSEEISINSLESFKNYPKSRVTKKTTGSAIYSRGSKFIWFMLCSDHHWGGRAKEFFWVKQDGVDVRLSMAEAVFEMMRKEGLCNDNNMPVHFLASPDDPTQAQNVKYRTEPDPNQITYNLIEKITGDYLRQAEKIKSRKSALKAAEKIRKLALIQFEKRGSDYLLEQLMQMMERHIEPNLDIFSAILRRAQSANLIIESVGEIAFSEYGGYDSRNIGLINIGTGNHFARTTDGEMIEGPLYSQRLRDLLLGTDEWRMKKEFINKHVLAPVYGKTCIGWGVISQKGKHEYGIEVRSAPTNMAGWGDTLKGHVKKDIQRGNYSRIWNKKLPILKFFGDKHFLGGVSTGYSFYHMSPASVHTDAYGEHGFPPNNTGVSFLGVPVDGPDTGPILWRCLPFDVIKSFVETNPRPFNWQEYLPNPA